jgi:hemerythrin-like domain-containing protein
MKREKFLWPLTHGHQHGLAAAKALKQRLAGEEGSTREGMGELRSQVAEFWDLELREHFKAEEGILRMLPRELPPEDPDVTRFYRDHRDLERLARGGLREDLSLFADLLARHIRFEEETLFGRIEAALSLEGRRLAGEIARKAETPAACPRLLGLDKG